MHCASQPPKPASNTNPACYIRTIPLFPLTFYQPDPPTPLHSTPLHSAPLQSLIVHSTHYTHSFERLCGCSTYLTNLLTDDDARIRRSAVALLPQAAAFLPTDIAHKLVTMMWEDWSEDVRASCFATLTAAGHTHLVYDSLELRLTSTSDLTRSNALKKIGWCRFCLFGPLLPVCAVVIFRFRTALFTARPSIQQNCLRYHILLCVYVCMCTRVCVCLSGQSICSLAGQLGTFPRRVQSHFLNCFRDAYPSVRSSAARAAGSLSALPYAVEAALYAAVSKDENAKVRLDAVNGKHTIVVMMMVMMVMVTWMSLILHLVVCLRLCGPGLSIALRRLHVDTPKHQGLLVWIVSCSLSENACQALSGCYNTNHTLACTRSGTCCRQIRYEGQPALVQAACRSVVELGLNANADVRSAVIWRCALACPVTHCPLVRSVPLPVCVFIPSCLAHTSQASVLPSSLFATTANLAAGCAGLPMRRRMRLRASQTNAAKPWDGQRGMTLRASSLLASKQP